jgi:AraC-like DNA-binding protein
MIIVRFILRATYNLGLQHFFDDLSGPFKAILIFNFPFYYLYNKSIIEDNTVFNKRDTAHLIVPTIFSSYIFLMYSMGHNEENFFKIGNFIFLIAISIYYSVLTFSLLKNKLWSVPENEQTEHYRLIRNWITSIYVLSLLIILRFIISISFEFYFNEKLSGDIFFVFHCIIWMAIFIKIIVSPEILYGLPKLHKKINSTQISNVEIPSIWNLQMDAVSNQKDVKLKEKIDDNVLNIIKEIEFLTVDQHFFRNQKVAISELSKEMNIPLSHLVYVFKYHCQLTFTEYKTQIKINDAKTLIENGFLIANTLESLATEVGFSSYNPFFTAFKKLVGMSPNEYALSLSFKEKEIPEN